MNCSPRLAIVLLMPLLAAMPVRAAPSNAEVAAKIKALQSRLQQQREHLDGLENELTQTEDALRSKQSALRALATDKKGAQKALQSAQREEAKLRTQLAGDQAAVAQQLRAAYRSGQREPIKLLLSQNNPATVGRALALYQRFAQGRVARMRGLVDAAREQAALAASFGPKLDAINALETETRAAVQDELLLKRQRARLLADLRARMRDSEGELRRLQDSERDLSRTFTALRASLADIAAAPAAPKPAPATARAPAPSPTAAAGFAGSRGRLPWPLRGPLIAQFGQTKAGDALRWKGHWMAAPSGTAVQAVAAGRAVYVGSMHRFGLIVILDHGGGFFTLYGHLAEAAARPGQDLRAGQTVGIAGDSGGHDQTGVYFEVRQGNQALNPADWLGP